MSGPYRLPLDSPRWNQVKTFGLSSNELPLILQELLVEPIGSITPALPKLMNAIFHQHELIEATYFAFPYLADVHARYGDTNPHLSGLIANIAASANIKKTDLPPEVRQTFLDTLIDLERRAISNVVRQGQPFGDIFGACMDAMAFSQHCCGRLLLDVLERDGANHTGLICPQCQRQMEVALFNDGLVVVERGQSPQPPELPRPLVKPLFRSSSERSPNPWHIVGSYLSEESQLASRSEIERLHIEMSIRLCALGVGPSVPPEEAFSLIGAILLTHGFTSSAHHFFRFWDTVACPTCKSTFIAAKGWWGCA